MTATQPAVDMKKIERLAHAIARYRAALTKHGLSVEVPGAGCELFMRPDRRALNDPSRQDRAEHVRIVQAKTIGRFAGLRAAAFHLDMHGARGWNPMELVRENEDATPNGLPVNELTPLRLATYALMSAATEINTTLGYDGDVYHGYLEGFATQNKFGLGLTPAEFKALEPLTRSQFKRDAKPNRLLAWAPFGKVEVAPKR